MILFFSLVIYLSVFQLSTHPPPYFCSMHPYSNPFIYSFLDLSIHPPIYSSIHPPIHPCTHPSTHAFAHPAIHPDVPTSYFPSFILLLLSYFISSVSKTWFMSSWPESKAYLHA